MKLTSSHWRQAFLDIAWHTPAQVPHRWVDLLRDLDTREREEVAHPVSRTRPH